MSAARAGNMRSFLERRVQIAKRRSKQHHFNGDRSSEMRPHNSPERIYIEYWMRNADGVKRLIENAVLRIEQKNPSHGLRQRRQEKREPEQKFQRALHRDVRSRDQPREVRADQ